MIYRLLQGGRKSRTGGITGMSYVLAGTTPPPPSVCAGTGRYLHTQDVMVRVKCDGSQTEEQLLIQANRDALAGMKKVNSLPKAERQAFIDCRFEARSRRETALPA